VAPECCFASRFVQRGYWVIEQRLLINCAVVCSSDKVTPFESLQASVDMSKGSSPQSVRERL
jgi:hypothetical protein